mmetsp:Transcript_65939/g.193351  ORF Transcript_65939/g.193351 Transcript_65939/m.193351 type:complete len:439 (-) Transcript_65939:42-1358(-)
MDRALESVPHPPLEVSLLDDVLLRIHEDHLELVEDASLHLLGVLAKRELPVLHDLFAACGLAHDVDRRLLAVVRLGVAHHGHDRVEALLGRNLRLLERLPHDVLVAARLVAEACDGAELRHKEDLLGVLLREGLEHGLLHVLDGAVVVSLVELGVGDGVLPLLGSDEVGKAVLRGQVEAHRLDPVEAVVVRRHHGRRVALLPPLRLDVGLGERRLVLANVQRFVHGLHDVWDTAGGVVLLRHEAVHGVDLEVRARVVQRVQGGGEACEDDHGGPRRRTEVHRLQAVVPPPDLLIHHGVRQLLGDVLQHHLGLAAEAPRADVVGRVLPYLPHRHLVRRVAGLRVRQGLEDELLLNPRRREDVARATHHERAELGLQLAPALLHDPSLLSLALALWPHGVVVVIDGPLRAQHYVEAVREEPTLLAAGPLSRMRVAGVARR